MDLLDAIAESRAVRSQEAYDVYITKDGVSYTPPPPPPGLLSKAGDVAMSAGEAVVDAAMDPVGTAKATGRAVAGGLRDFSQGVIDLSSELGGMIETNVGSLGYLNVDENGVNWSKEPPAGAQPGQLGDLPDVPKGDSMAEGFARGLVQFAAGMAAAPVRGAGMGANMLRSGFADALLDPEEGNLSSLLKGMGLDYAVLDYLDSKVDSDAGPEDRLKARILQAVEGTAIGVPIDVVMAGFRLIRSNKEAVEAVKETLAQAPPPTDTQVMPSQSFFDKAGEATDRFVTQAATTTDEVATSAARATDEFVSPTAQPPAGQVATGDLGKQIDEARAAYEASPNDPQLRLDYFDLRKQRDADPVAQAQPPTDAEPGIIAFHGSAADFDQFRLEKIGTGEGNQIYGWGLYFADKEAIADFYRGALTDAPFDYKIHGQSVSEMYRNAVYAENYELADVLEQVQLHDTPKTLKAKFTVENGYAQETADFVADLDYGKLTGVDVDGKEIPLGRIYKVGLTPKPDDLLDYDKSFSEQTPAIQAALRKIGYKPEREFTVTRDGDERVVVYEVGDSGQNKFVKHFIDGVMGVSGEVQASTYIKTLEKQSFEATGGDIVNFMANEITRKAGSSNVNGAEMLSKDLLEAGIPGIKYLENNDNESVKQSNYVIFDDSMIKILEKYGIVGPVAISAAAASKGGQKDDET